MKILITGVAGFVGFSLARFFKEYYTDVSLIGIDNLSRNGSHYNLSPLKELGCSFVHGDVRNREDIENLPKVDWIIDCAANPSVLGGVSGSSLGLINNNLTGTIYLLEKCNKDNSGLTLLSTSRVYSINELNKIPLKEAEESFVIDVNRTFPEGFSSLGVSESFSTAAPISLYGATKLASEVMALEYHYTFGFPLWINRCGVIAGPGQFGKIDQGIMSFWIYQYFLNNPLSYIGFGGKGKQVRDFVHPLDLFKLIQMQIKNPTKAVSKLVNIGGGVANACSLKQLDNYCRQLIKKDKVIESIEQNRKFDVSLYISDYSSAQKCWEWEPSVNLGSIIDQIIKYTKDNLSLVKNL